jgi:hypothetical protein
MIAFLRSWIAVAAKALPVQPCFGAGADEAFGMQRRRFVGLGAALCLGSAGPLLCAPPQLCLDGDISAGSPVFLDLEDLLEFPQTSFETTTIWTEAPHVFSGPSLSGVLGAFGAGQGDLTLTGLDSYRVTLRRSMVDEVSPIIAISLDGQRIRTRNRGPYWLMFPFDSRKEFQAAEYFAASVWHLAQITVQS